MIWIRRLLYLAVVAAAVTLLVLGLLPKPVLVDVATATRGPFRVTVDEDGRSRVKDRHEISAPIAGHVARIELHPGDAVRAGDVVARLLPVAPPLLDARSRAEAEARVGVARAAEKQAEAAVTRAEAALAHAKLEQKRAQELAAKGALAPGDLDRANLEVQVRTRDLESARFAVRAAQHEITMAEVALRPRPAAGALEELELRSPLDGRVLRVLRESEGTVPAGAPLVELGDPAALEIVVDVLSADAVRIRPGALVEIAGWGGPHALTGRVRLIEPAAFSRVSALGIEEQRVNVIIDLDGDPATWAGLGDGWRVEARIVVAQAADAVTAPASAVFRAGTGWAVFVVRGGKASRREVVLGERGGLAVQITAGLEPGEVVVVHPSDRVTDGVAVKAR